MFWAGELNEPHGSWRFRNSFSSIPIHTDGTQQHWWHTQPQSIWHARFFHQKQTRHANCVSGRAPRHLSLQWVSLPFSRFSFASEHSIRENCQQNKIRFPCLSHCSKASLLWFHCAKGSPVSSVAKVSFRICACHYKQIAHGYLFPILQSLLWGAPVSRKSCNFHPFTGLCCSLGSPFAFGRSIQENYWKKLQFPRFSHCRKASLLWFQC